MPPPPAIRLIPKSVRKACSVAVHALDEDVGGLHVAVEQAAFVGGVEPCCDAGEQVRARLASSGPSASTIRRRSLPFTRRIDR